MLLRLKRCHERKRIQKPLSVTCSVFLFPFGTFVYEAATMC